MPQCWERHREVHSSLKRSSRLRIDITQKNASDIQLLFEVHGEFLQLPRDRGAGVAKVHHLGESGVLVELCQLGGSRDGDYLKIDEKQLKKGSYITWQIFEDPFLYFLWRVDLVQVHRDK